MSTPTRLGAWIAALVGGAILLAAAAAVLWPGLDGADDGSMAAASPESAAVAGIRRPDPVRWNGVTWVRLPHAIEAGGEVVGIHGATGAGDTLVAWGRLAAPGRNEFNEVAGILVSRDGGAWNISPVTDGVGPADTAEISGVVTSPAGGMLAWGGTCCRTEERAVWHSPDGHGWTRLPITGDIDPRRTWLTDLIATPSGWVLAGTSEDGRHSAIWHSADGSHWTAATVEVGDQPFVVLDLAPGADGPIAVGHLDADDGTRDALVLASDDGTAWRRIGAEDAALAAGGDSELYHVVPHAGGALAFGNHGPTEARNDCGGRSRMLASTDALPVGPASAWSCAWGREHVWLTEDGTAWERLDVAELPGVVRPIEFRVTAAAGPGLLVLGEGSGPASPDTVLFASADGRTWTELGPEQPLRPTMALGMTVDGDRIVALVERFDGVRSVYELWGATAER